MQSDLDRMIVHKRLAHSAGTIRQLSSQLSEYRHTILAASSHNLQVPSPPRLLGPGCTVAPQPAGRVGETLDRVRPCQTLSDRSPCCSDAGRTDVLYIAALQHGRTQCTQHP